MSLIKNSTIVIVGVLGSNALAYAFHFIAGRMLGPEKYGVFGALMALFLLVALPAIAINSTVTKFTAAFYSDKKFGHISLLRKKVQNDVLLFSSIMLVLIILFSTKISAFLNIESNTPIIIIGCCLVTVLLLPINRGLLQGMKKYTAYSWNTILEALSRLVLLILLLLLGLEVNGAILAYGLAYLVGFLIIFPKIKEARITPGAAAKIEFKPIYKFLLLVLVVNLIIQSIINVPSLFIKHYYSDEFTGYWTAALNIARISLFVSTAISIVMFPEVAGEKENTVKNQIFIKAATLVLLAASAIALIFYFIPEFLIGILYGKDFIAAAPILIWMGLAMILIGLLQLWFNYLLAKHNTLGDQLA